MVKDIKRYFEKGYNDEVSPILDDKWTYMKFHYARDGMKWVLEKDAEDRGFFKVLVFDDYGVEYYWVKVDDDKYVYIDPETNFDEWVPEIDEDTPDTIYDEECLYEYGGWFSFYTLKKE